MDTYYRTDAFIGGRVYCNAKPIETIAIQNNRFNQDNRIPIAGKGMVNFGFDRYFRFKGGMIGETDSKPKSIIVDNDVVAYRYFRSNGSGFIKETIS